MTINNDYILMSIQDIFHHKHKQSHPKFDLNLKKLIILKSSNISKPNQLLNSNTNHLINTCIPNTNSKKIYKTNLLSQNQLLTKTIHIHDNSNNSTTTPEYMPQKSQQFKQIQFKNKKNDIENQTDYTFVKQRYKIKSVQRSRLLDKSNNNNQSIQKPANKSVHKLKKPFNSFILKLDLPEDYSHAAQIKLRKFKAKQKNNTNIQKSADKNSFRIYKDRKSQTKEIPDFLKLNLNLQISNDKNMKKTSMDPKQKSISKLNKKTDKQKFKKKIDFRKFTTLIQPQINQAKLHSKQKFQKINFNIMQRMRLTNRHLPWSANHKARTQQKKNSIQIQICPWKHKQKQYEEIDFF